MAVTSFVTWYTSVGVQEEPGSCGAGRGRGGRRARAGREGDSSDGDPVGRQGRVDRGHHGVSEGERGIYHDVAEEVDARGDVGHRGRCES